MAVRQQQTTLEQFLALPEAEPALEYWDGAVAQKVSPKARHGLLQFTSAERLNHVAFAARIGIALPETRCTFGGISVVPDVVFFLWDRLPRDKKGELLDDISAAPDIAIEILSPGQSLRDLIDRCRWYVDNDVRIALLVDPRTRTVRVFRQGTHMVILRGSDAIDVSEVVATFRLTVDELFRVLQQG